MKSRFRFLQKPKPGCQDLSEAIYNFAVKGERAGESIVITRERHRDHLQQAATALDAAYTNMKIRLL